MRVIKPMSLSCASRPHPVRDGVTRLIVTAMAGYVQQGTKLEFCGEQSLWKSLGLLLPKAAAPDLCFPKPRGEWMVLGHAFPKKPDAVSAKVRTIFQREGSESLEKSLHISGNRKWLSRVGFAVPSEPELLTGPVPLTWDHAYGGMGHAMNPQGLGLYPQGEWEGKALPHIEYWDELMVSPGDRPRPGGFGPLPLDAPGRWQPSGTYDDEWRAQDFPGIAADTPPEVFMLAPVDQRIEGFFRPGDQWTCEGMMPGGQSIHWRFPDQRARTFIRRGGKGTPLTEIQMQADTVILLPEKGILAIIWRGETVIGEKDAYDVKLLLGAMESSGEAKPLEHYDALVLSREGLQKEAALAALDEAPLVPEGTFSPLIPKLPPSAQLHIKDISEKAKRQVEGLKHKEDRGSPASPQVEKLRPISDEALSISQNIVDVLSAEQPDGAKLKALVEQAHHLGEEARKAALKKLEDFVASQNKDPKKELQAHLRKKYGGPPVRRMPKIAQTPVTGGAVRPGQLELKAKLEQVLQVANDRYRKSAHILPLGAPVTEPMLLRDHILNLLERGDADAEIFNSDWVGADLSNLNLDGARLAGAFLDGANLSNSSLVGSNLNQATLAGADLRGADFRGAQLEGVNFGNANLQGAIFDEALLRSAIFDRALLDGASFKRAQLKKASFIGTKFGSANFSGANLLESKILGLKLETPAGVDVMKAIEASPDRFDRMLEPVDIAEADFSRARLVNSVWLSCEGPGARFMSADLSRASILQSNLSKIDFSRAVFKKTNVVLKNKIEESNFHGATLTESCFFETSMKRSDFRGAVLSKSLFSSADLSNSSFLDVAAISTRFDRSNLQHSTFESANLSGARFNQAQLEGANYENASLSFVDFTDARIDEKTRFNHAKINNALMPKKGGKP